MRKENKINAIAKANLMAENTYLKTKGLINEDNDLPIEKVVLAGSKIIVGDFKYGVGFIPNQTGIEKGLTKNAEIPKGTEIFDDFSERELGQTRRDLHHSIHPYLKK